MLQTFLIYCDSDLHSNEVVKVKTLTFVPSADGVLEWAGTGVMDLRIGDDYVPVKDGDNGRAWLDLATSPGARWRRRFTCPKCGDPVEVREEKLRPIVDLLMGHGVSRLSLAGLRGRLETQL